MILHTAPEPALALALARLVEGAVDGLLRDAAIVDALDDPLAARLADEGGCALFRGSPAESWRAAAQAARGDWVLLVPSGLAPARGWTGPARDALQLAAAGDAAPGRIFEARTADGGLFARLAAQFAPPPAILLARRDMARAVAGAQPCAALRAALARGGARRVPGVAVDERAR
ncbi:MAG: hypothetical protein JNK46_14675 [Methylobacteriaceae bacterium]|nr:hypothetical protein [Methylobacteriaceae bacterium]